ncbi:hypothetical protein KY289_007985 [Solanum tuberosum]|nr:hypothetical protein KY289_007985 [Solanum tuberosum]
MLVTMETAPAGKNNRGGLLPIPNQDNMNRPQQAPILPPRVGDEQRVETVALYLNGAAEVWYRSVILSGGIRNWIEFKEELLNQTGIIDDFLGKFEDLKA